MEDAKKYGFWIVLLLLSNSVSALTPNLISQINSMANSTGTNNETWISFFSFLEQANILSAENDTLIKSYIDNNYSNLNSKLQNVYTKQEVDLYWNLTKYWLISELATSINALNSSNVASISLMNQTVNDFIENMNETTVKYTQNYFDDYTLWFEKQFDIASKLSSILSIINSTTDWENWKKSLNENMSIKYGFLQAEYSQEKTKLEDIVDTQISKLKSDLSNKLADYCTKNEVYNITGGITGFALQNRDEGIPSWVFWVLGTVVVLFAIYMRFKPKQKQFVPQEVRREYIPEKPQSMDIGQITAKPKGKKKK